MGIIEVKDLVYFYPNATSPTLNKINLDIDRGEFILLTGQSGCGKTTFCRCLNGLIPHFYNGELMGEVNVSGLSVSDNSCSKLSQHVGLVFQNPDNQIFALTVEKDVAFGLENLGLNKNEMHDAINWAMKATGIYDLRNRATHELSGGQKQRLAIASILAMKPDILILDEPTSFLDPVGAESIFNVLKNLNKTYRITIILIEHRLDLAAQYANRLIVFGDGQIINDGLPTEVFMLDETKLAGVGIPKIIELYKGLNKKGFNIGVPSISPHDLVTQLKDKYLNAEKDKIRKKDLQDLEDEIIENRDEPVIEVKNLSYTYPSGIQALTDVSITICKGEFVAIMGENGAGKTTLVKHFNGLLRPQKGSIIVQGEDISNHSVADISRHVGLVFQNPDDQLFSENVEKEIGFALNNFGFGLDIIEKRVDWALNLLDIERYRETSPFILSGGERKRVALASVLAWDPNIVVLDEPTIGQDYAQKEKLRHFLMQLRTQGKTTIIVTHDVEFVAECKPRIVLMAKGKILADGAAEKVLSNHKVLEKASVTPPEITKVFSMLSNLGLPNNVLGVRDAVDLLSAYDEGRK